MRLVRRVAVLLIAGLAYNCSMSWIRDGTVSWQELRWTGVLQMYAALVLVIAVLHRFVRGWTAWLLASISLGAAHSALLVWAANHCPDQLLTPQCNPSLRIDGAIFPHDHLYWQFSAGHDPEGVVALLGACATAAAGTAAAHALRRKDRDAPSGRRRAHHREHSTTSATLLRLVVVAMVLGAASVVTAFFVPPMKRLWTAPFGFSIAAGVVIVIAVVHAIVDAPSVGGSGSSATARHHLRWAAATVRFLREPFIALGRNSLLVYFGSHVAIAFLLLRPLGASESPERTYAMSLAAGMSWLGGPQIGLSAGVLGLWWVLAWHLHRHRWYMRA